MSESQNNGNQPQAQAQEQASQDQRTRTGIFDPDPNLSIQNPDSTSQDILHVPKRARTSEPFINTQEPDTLTTSSGLPFPISASSRPTRSSNDAIVVEPVSAPPSSTTFNQNQPYKQTFRPPLVSNPTRQPYWERSIPQNPNQSRGQVPQQPNFGAAVDQYTGIGRPATPFYFDTMRSSSRPPTPITPMTAFVQSQYAIPYSTPMNSSISSSSTASSSTSATHRAIQPLVPSQPQHYLHQSLPNHHASQNMYTSIPGPSSHMVARPEPLPSSSSSTLSYLPLDSKRQSRPSTSNSNSPSPPLQEASPSQPPATPISTDPNSEINFPSTSTGTSVGVGAGKSKGKHKGIPGPKARIPIEAKVAIAEHIISKGVAMANLDELAQMTGLTKQQIKSQLVDNRQNVRKQLNEFARSLQ